MMAPIIIIMFQHPVAMVRDLICRGPFLDVQTFIALVDCRSVICIPISPIWTQDILETLRFTSVS
jgi:hypothetical protein